MKDGISPSVQRWQPPSGQRCRELAKKSGLSLSDFIELTGQAPDRGGMIGVLGADATGLYFTLSEHTLRLRPAMDQREARRLVETYRLPFPCTPSELVAFCKEWGEFELPARFLRAVESQQAELAGVGWRDGLVAKLQAHGLATAQVDYPTFLKLTTFSRERHLDGGEYVERIDNGQVAGLIAGDAWIERGTAGDAEHLIAVEFMAAAKLDFPVAAESLVHWIHAQGLGTVELLTEDIDALSSVLIAQPTIATTTTDPKGMTVVEAARKGGAAKNVENKKKREEAVRLYRSSNFATKEVAAEKIAEKLRMSFGTVRNWLKGVSKPS